MAELADAKDLGSFGVILAGSTPVAPTSTDKAVNAPATCPFAPATCPLFPKNAKKTRQQKSPAPRLGLRKNSASRLAGCYVNRPQSARSPALTSAGAEVRRTIGGSGAAASRRPRRSDTASAESVGITDSLMAASTSDSATSSRPAFAANQRARVATASMLARCFRLISACISANTGRTLRGGLPQD